MADMVPVSKLKANPTNPRVLRDEKFAKLKASIQSFPDMLNYRGIVAVTDTDGKFMVLGGNMRLRAMQDLGIKEVPVMIADHWTEEQRREFIIKDNVGFGEWDWDNLANEWDAEQLAEWGLDLPVDFGAETNEGLTDPDEVPEVPVNPITVLGDVWVLGKHRIVCGDSTEADTVAKCLNGVKPHLMVTDPPYGVEYDANWRNDALGGKPGGRSTGKVENDERADWSEAWALFPGDVAYVWQGDKQITDMARQLANNDFQTRNLIVWAKSQFAISRGDYHPMHETCWYAVRKGRKGHYCGDRKQTTLWQIDKPQKSETGHSTQKPVECMKRPIENNSKKGDAVYEPFSGSGTTIIAGEMTGRSVHAIELHPPYVDVTVRRWQDFTGKQAIHEGTGLTFEELTKKRSKGK